MTHFRNVSTQSNLSGLAHRTFLVLCGVALMAPLIVSVSWDSTSFGPSAAEAAVEREITLPIAAADVSRVSWTDTWGAARSGGRSHLGVDMLGPKMVPLLAANDGEITWGRFDNAGGNILRMRDTEGWEYQYIHINNDSPGTDNGAASCNQAFSAKICGGVENGNLQRGMAVKAGELIAFMGDSGNAERVASHLHFEVYNPSGTPVNPTPFVNDALARLRQPPSVPTTAVPTTQAPTTAAPTTAAPTTVAPVTVTTLAPTTVPAPATTLQNAVTQITFKTAPPPNTPARPGRKVVSWPNSNVAAQTIFTSLQGRFPTLAERRELRQRIDAKGVEGAVAERAVVSNVAQIDRLYLAVLGRNADPAGLIYWLKQYGKGVSLADIAYSFSVSEEFKRRNAGKNDADFVVGIYTAANGKAPSQSVRESFASNLRSGKLKRGEFIVSHTESKAMHERSKLRSEAVASHRAVRRGHPRQHQLDRWAQLRSNKSLSAVIKKRLL